MKKIYIIVGLVCIIIFFSTVASASDSALEMEIILQYKEFYPDDVVKGKFTLKNTGMEFIHFYWVEVKVVSRSGETIEYWKQNLSSYLPLPPYQSVSQPIEEKIPHNISEGTYRLVVTLNHSNGISKIEKEIIIKNRKPLAEEKIKKAEEKIKKAEKLVNESNDKEALERLNNAKKYLNDAKECILSGEYSIAIDYAKNAYTFADLSIERSKAVLQGKESDTKSDIVDTTVSDNFSKEQRHFEEPKDNNTIMSNKNKTFELNEPPIIRHYSLDKLFFASIATISIIIVIFLLFIHKRYTNRWVNSNEETAKKPQKTDEISTHKNQSFMNKPAITEYGSYDVEKIGYFEKNYKNVLIILEIIIALLIIIILLLVVWKLVT